MQQQIGCKSEDGVEIRLETRPAHARRVHVAVGLHLRRLGLQQVVHGVAGHGRCPAGAPYFTVQLDHAGLRRGHIASAAPHLDKAVDERQLMVFLQKEDRAVSSTMRRGCCG